MRFQSYCVTRRSAELAANTARAALATFIYASKIVHRFRKPALVCWLSRSMSSRLRAIPHAYPDREPSVRTTRWQGMATAMLFSAQAPATARTDVGDPILLATSAYETVVPAEIFCRARQTRR